MKRPGLLPGLVLVAAFVAETVYFGRLAWAAFLEMGGQRAYFRNDLVAAWDLTHRAVALGGDGARLEEHLLAILLMGFTQRDVGIEIAVPLEGEAGEEEAVRLLHERLTDTPHRASLWSNAADQLFHRAQEERRARPIDLSTLSEHPIENLLPNDRLGLAALEKAAALEPNNYLYHELLTEKFLEYGSEEDAVRSCRLAVAAYPKLDGHTYLSRFDLPPALVDAAVAGFEDALKEASLIARVETLRDAGRVLVRHDRDEEAVPYLLDAVRVDPGYYDARMDLAMARLRLSQWAEAENDLEAAVSLSREDPVPHYFLATLRRRVHDDDGAIEELRRARALGASETKIFLAMGESFEAIGRLKEAENQFTAATNLHPEDVSAWSGLYSFAMRHEDTRLAMRACARMAGLKGMDEGLRQRCAAFPAGGS
jgi:tetratricopeptide (TPR) repeat protein